MLEMEIMDLSAQLSSVRPEWAEGQLELWTVLSSLYSFASRILYSKILYNPVRPGICSSEGFSEVFTRTEPNAVSIYSHHNDNEINQSQCFDCTIRVRNKTRARHYQYPVAPAFPPAHSASQSSPRYKCDISPYHTSYLPPWTSSSSPHTECVHPHTASTS